MAQKLHEQVANEYGIQRRRASAAQTHAPASRQYAGHYAGNHPEDTPYFTGGRPGRVMPPHGYNVHGNGNGTGDGNGCNDGASDGDIDDDDDIYPQRSPTSARRYIQNPTEPYQEVYTQGNKKIVVHREGPPKKYRVHWILVVGIAVFVMIAGYMLLNEIGIWWQTKQDDWKYGSPRTFQINQYVGHADSPTHPNHFIAINLAGTIEVMEINTTIPKDDHIYAITTATDASTPVSIAFDDTNHDGKVDMLVTIGDTNPYTVVMLNNGSIFQH